MVMVVAMAWSLATIGAGPAVNAYSHMFDAWEMRSMPVEEAREATGLLIVAGWMLVIAVAQRPSTSLRPAPSIVERRGGAPEK